MHAKTVAIFLRVCYNSGMGKITEIACQRKNKNRVNVYLDGVFVCGLEALTAVKYRLQPGVEISEDELSAIQLESESGTAFEKAVKFVSIRLRTESEIKKFLREKGYTYNVLSAVLQKLREYGLCDDRKFCFEYVAAYRTKAGVNKIRAELKRLGADSTAAEEALEEIDSQADAAFAAAEKYIRTHRDFVMAKLKHHLYARGFSYSDIDAALERVKEEYSLYDEEEF